MEKGYITIKENESGEFTVEIKLIDGNLWLTKHEIAYLFNVFVSAVEKNLCAIFQSGMLCEEEVTRIHSYERNGKLYQTTFYNLEALLFVSYRLASFEARAFRKWALKSFRECAGRHKANEPKVLTIFFNAQKMPFSLN